MNECVVNNKSGITKQYLLTSQNEKMTQDKNYIK